MTRQKTSKARFYTARLNPRPENPREVEAVRILDEKAAQGFNFKQVIVDAILFADGRTPDMFDERKPEFELSESSLAVITATVRAALKNAKFSGESRGSDDDFEDEDSELSDFTRNFATGFMQRRSSIHGNED